MSGDNREEEIAICAILVATSDAVISQKKTREEQKSMDQGMVFKRRREGSVQHATTRACGTRMSQVPKVFFVLAGHKNI